MATQNICFFNKYGFCKYSEKCRRYHENTICEKSQCEIRECHQRHPKECKFFRDFGFCKYSEWCKYSHNFHENYHVKKENVKKIEDKLDIVETELQKKNDKVLKLEEKIKDIHLKMSEKDQTISKINKKLNVLKEKVTLLFDLESKYDTLEKIVDKMSKESSEKIVEKAVSIGQEDSKPPEKFKCSVCDFVAKNNFGLKIHFHKKHSSVKFNCFTCDFKCETHSELMEHNEKYYYSHRQVLNKYYEKDILDEIQQLDEDGFLIHRTLGW